MREIHGDIWDHQGTAVIAITTNGLVTKKGLAVFGRGCAGQAKERFPYLPERLGGLLADGNGNIDSLTEALRTLMADDERRAEMGKAAIASVARYEPEKIFDAWEALLKEVERR